MTTTTRTDLYATLLVLAAIAGIVYRAIDHIGGIVLAAVVAIADVIADARDTNVSAAQHAR